MRRVLFATLCIALGGCDLATGLSDLRFDLGGGASGGGAGGIGGGGGTTATGGTGGRLGNIITLGERPDADLQAVTRDTFVSVVDQAANYGALDLIIIDAGGLSYEVGLLRFDLTSVPADRTIQSASLELVVGTCAECASPDDFGLHAMLQDWDEGDEQGTPGFASYADAKAGVPWLSLGVGGGTYDRQLIDNFSSPSFGERLELQLDVAVVNGWLEDPSSNFGLRISGVAGINGVRIVSSEGPEGDRPLLTLVVEGP